MQEQAAFELKVEIVQDYSDLEKDIFDVLKVVERNESYESVRQKVNFFNFKSIQSLVLKTVLNTKVDFKILSHFQFLDNADKLLKELSIAESIQQIIRNVDF